MTLYNQLLLLLLTNANPGLKVNQGNNFSCIKVLSIAYVLFSLRLLMLKTEGQKIKTVLFAEILQRRLIMKLVNQ